MARHAIIAAAALLLSGCITFPEELLLADGNKGDVTGEARRETSSPDLDGSVDATRDGIADVPRPDTLSDGLDADGAPPVCATAGSGCLAAQQAFNGGCCNP